MGLSAFDFAGSFLGGVQERAQEYDDALAKRIQKLADKGPSDTTKSKYAAEYADYKADKKTLEAIQAAGITSDRGQMLAGGYDSMQDYLDARASAKLAGEDLYHEMFTIGDEPKYTPADYGITNVRDDGSTVTTAGQMFDQFFRPDVYKARIGELTPTPTAETSTTYRRGKNERTAEDIQKSKDAIIARAVALQSAGEHDKLPAELTVNRVVDGVMMTYTLMKTDNKKIGIAFEGFDRYRQIGDGVEKDTKSDWAVKMEEHEKTKPVDINSPTYEKRLEEWTYKFNKLMFGETFKEGPDVGDVISGVYNNKNQKVNVQYTGKDTDLWNGMEGYRLFGEPEPEDTPNEITVNKLIDGVMHTYSLIKTSNTNIGTALEDFEGYRVIGEPVPTDAISNLQEQLNEHGEEPNSSQYETVEMYESARDIWRKGYNKILYGITSLEDSDGPKVGTITSGVLNDKGVKVNVQFTGKSTDNFMGMEGYRLFGGDKESTDTRTESSKKLDEQAERIITSSKYLNYDPILVHMGIVDDDDKPLELDMDIARILAERFNAMDITIDGDVVDRFMAQFDTPTPLYELKPEGWSNVNPKQVEKYSLGYFGKVEGTKYYKSLEEAKNYMGWINSKARTWANAYYMDEAEAVSVVERLALLGVQKEPNNRDLNDLWFNQFGTVHRHPTKNIEYSLDDLFAQARAFKNLDSQRNRTWHQSLTKFFEAIQLDEAALKTLRNE